MAEKSDAEDEEGAVAGARAVEEGAVVPPSLIRVLVFDITRRYGGWEVWKTGYVPCLRLLG